MSTRLVEFGKIDHAADPSVFFRFLDDASAEASFQAYKRQLLDLLAPAPGLRVLDVGCGTGDDVRAMAALVGPAGKSVGVDNSRLMIDEARRRAGDGDPAVEFHVAEATALPFADGTFDACRADRSLMHVPDARRVLAEMARVTKPGGRVAAYEVDFETLVIAPGERGLARRLVHFWCDGFRDGWLGRRIPAILLDLGLSELQVIPHTLRLTPALALPFLGAATVERAVEAGTVTADEGRAWLEGLDEARRSGRLFSTLTGFLVAGRR
jgi:ubiquinone/menaquinone biosynthesis C-methylase UbiE